MLLRLLFAAIMIDCIVRIVTETFICVVKKNQFLALRKNISKIVEDILVKFCMWNSLRVNTGMSRENFDNLSIKSFI